jgi:hypothetical protein
MELGAELKISKMFLALLSGELRSKGCGGFVW